MHILVDGAKLKKYQTTCPKPTEDEPNPDPVTQIQIDVTDMNPDALHTLHRMMRSGHLTLVVSTTQRELDDVFGSGIPNRRGKPAGVEAVTIGVREAGQPEKSVTFTNEDAPKLEALARDLAAMPAAAGAVRGLKDRIGDELEAAGFEVERDAVITVPERQS